LHLAFCSVTSPALGHCFEVAIYDSTRVLILLESTTLGDKPSRLSKAPTKSIVSRKAHGRCHLVNSAASLTEQAAGFSQAEFLHKKSRAATKRLPEGE
jgi:hypothetical protein